MGVIAMPRGGKRPGAGRPRKPLAARIEERVDAVSHRKPQVLGFPLENQTAKSKKSNIIQKSKPYNQKTNPDNQKSKPEPQDTKQPLPSFLDMAC